MTLSSRIAMKFIQEAAKTALKESVRGTATAAIGLGGYYLIDKIPNQATLLNRCAFFRNPNLTAESINKFMKSTDNTLLSYN